MKVCLILVATCVVVGVSGLGIPLSCGDSAPSPQTTGCRYFTRDYYGKYVCDRNQKPANKCPTVRPTCLRGTFAPPFPCVTDNDCAYADKCCCDACLDHLVCKPAA